MELAWLITLSNSFLRRGNKKAANWAISYSKQQQYNRQIWEYSIQIIILPQSLSDRQYLGDTGYHKLSFRHWHLEVSKHRSAWETDVLSFLKTIGRCGSPALFFWLRYSELILFPRLSLAILKYFKPLFQLTCSLADSWLQNWPFCKPSIIVEYGLPLNIFRNGTLAPSCVSLIPFGFYTTVLFAILLSKLSFSVWLHHTKKGLAYASKSVLGSCLTLGRSGYGLQRTLTCIAGSRQPDTPATPQLRSIPSGESKRSAAHGRVAHS